MHYPSLILCWSPLQKDTKLRGSLGWERELNLTFSDNQRHHILRFTHKSLIYTKIQETNYKLLTRWYRTPVLLHKFFPATSDICWRCGEERGTLLHIFWSCPKMVDFWKTVCLYVVLHKSSQNALSRKSPRFFYYMHPQLQSASIRNLWCATSETQQRHAFPYSGNRRNHQP